MTYPNAVIPTYKTIVVEPVQFESVIRLTGTYLDDGRAILMWISSDEVRLGFVSSSKQWAIDASCTSATTILTDIGDAHGVCCFRVGAGLFFYVIYRKDNQQRGEIYEADSTSNPTSWSLYSTVHSVNLTSNLEWYRGDADANPGMPTVIGSTWLLPGTRGFNPLTTSATRAALYRSTDDGVTWARMLDPAIGNGQGWNAHATMGHVGIMPNGDLYWGVSGGFGGPGDIGLRWYESTDDGATWSQVYSETMSSSPVCPSPFMNDSSDLIAGTRTASNEIQRLTQPETTPHGTTLVDLPAEVSTEYDRWCIDQSGDIYGFFNFRVLAPQLGKWLLHHYIP